MHACVVVFSVMWHPSGDSSTFITLADSHILVCDVEPSGRTAKVRRDCVVDSGWLKGTLHSKWTLGFFSWPKSICYCDLSLTNCTFVKLELRVQGAHFYVDAGEFDGCSGISLGIWSQWLYHGTDDKLALVVTVASIVTGIMVFILRVSCPQGRNHIFKVGGTIPWSRVLLSFYRKK